MRNEATIALALDERRHRIAKLVAGGDGSVYIICPYYGPAEGVVSRLRVPRTLGEDGGAWADVVEG
jgi:hypothetical protein